MPQSWSELLHLAQYSYNSPVYTGFTQFQASLQDRLNATSVPLKKQKRSHCQSILKTMGEALLRTQFSTQVEPTNSPPPSPEYHRSNLHSRTILIFCVKTILFFLFCEPHSSFFTLGVSLNSILLPLVSLH